jgi:hypothetical protein
MKEVMFRPSVYLALAVLLMAHRVSADTVEWIGAAGAWSQATNWTPHSPSSADTVVITNNGSVTLDETATIATLVLGAAANCGNGTLNLNGMTLLYSGQVTVNPCGQLLINGGSLFGIGSNYVSGSFTWASGPFPFGASVTFGPNSTLNIITGVDHDMPGVTMTNYGTVLWSGGRVRGGGTPGTFIYNYGVWDSQGDLTFNSDFTQQGLAFNNLGTLRKSAGTNSTVFSPNGSEATLNNSGVVDIQTGSIVLNGGGTFTAGSVSGNGVLYLSAGGFNLNGTLTTATNVQFTGGGFYGDNTIIGGLTWVGGNWNSASSVTVTTNGELDITSGADHDLASCGFTNLGKVEWLGGRIRGGSTPGTVFYNQGLWEVRCDQALNSDYSQMGVIFYNLGTFRKLVTTNSTTFSPNGSQDILINTGLVDIQSGSVVLNGGGVLSGGAVAGSGVLYLNAGGFILNGTLTTVTNVLLTGGSLVGPTAIMGGLSWVSGSLNGASMITVSPKSELDITSSADHDMASCLFINQGTVEWLNGRIRGGGSPGTLIYNLGVWETRCDQAINSDFSQGGLVFDNEGTLRKLGTTGSTIFSPNGSPSMLINAGVLDVESGSLMLNGGATLTNSTISGAGIVYLNNGAFHLTGTATTTTNVLFTGGFFAGDNTIIGGLTWAGGNWNGATSVTLATNSLLIIASSSDLDMPSCIFTNFGTVNWQSGRVRGGLTPGSYIYNYGVWNSQGDLTFNSDFQQQGLTFNNYGTLRKSAGTNSTMFNPNGSLALLNNRGQIDIQSGSVVLNGGGVLTAGAVTGPGPLYLNAGGFTLNGTLTTTNVLLTGGALTGTNVLQGLTWVGGNWDNVPAVTLTSGSQLYIVSTSDHDLFNCTFTNRGQVEWMAGRLRGGSVPGTQIYNIGLWEVRCDFAVNSDFQQNGFVFNNQGTFRKLATGGSTVFSPNGSRDSFVNVGTVDIQMGTLVLNGGGTFSAGSVNGPVVLGGGGFNFNGALTTTNVQLAGGVLVGRNLLQGGFTWSSGNWNGAGPITLALGSELDIVSGADHDMASCTFSNLGHVLWLGGRLRGGSTPGTVVQNVGFWDARCDQAFNSDFQQFGIVFNNEGVFRKSGTTGTTAFAPNSSQATFNNLGGTIELDSGTLSLAGNFAQNGGPLIIGLGGTNSGQWGLLAASGQANLNGPLTVNIQNGFNFLAGEQFQILACANPFRTGQFSSATLPTGLAVQYFSSSVILSATSNGGVLLQAPEVSGGLFSFGFMSVSNQSYTVQRNTDLSTTNWTFYTNLTGNGGLLQVVAPASNPPQAFFRVRQP